MPGGMVMSMGMSQYFMTGHTNLFLWYAVASGAFGSIPVHDPCVFYESYPWQEGLLPIGHPTRMTLENAG